MTLNDVYKIADEIAPKALSDALCSKYGMYDNSGVLVDTGKSVDGILFSLDFSLGAIAAAIKAKHRLIVTHHPAIYGKIGNLVGGESCHGVRDVLGTGGKLIRAIENGISVLSMHLNLDCADGGIDESLMRGAMLSAARANGRQAGEDTFADAKAEKRMLTVETDGVSGGYGRIYDVENCGLFAFCEELKKTFSTMQVCVYGNRDARVSRVASFCGAGADEESLAFACGYGADTFISSDFKHHVVAAAREKNKSVIILTHYASENYGFEKYYQKIRKQSEVPCEFYTDEELL